MALNPYSPMYNVLDSSTSTYTEFNPNPNATDGVKGGTIINPNPTVPSYNGGTYHASANPNVPMCIKASDPTKFSPNPDA